MTIALSFGAWGGFYCERSDISWRACLGWVAFTILFEDLDVWLERYVDLSECHDDHYQSMLAFGREAGALRAALEKIALDSHAPSRDAQGNSVEWYAEQAEIWAQQALDEWAMADDAHWLQWHTIALRSRLDRAEGELKGMVEQADNMHRECAFWRDQYQRVAYRLEKEAEDEQ